MTDAQLQALAKSGNQSVFLTEWMKMHPTASGADAAMAYNYFSSLNSGKPPINTISSAIARGGSGNFMKDLASAGSKDNPGEVRGEFFKFSDLVDENSWTAGIGGFKGVALNAISALAGKVKDLITITLAQQNDLILKLNSDTGMLGELSAGFRSEITEAAPVAAGLGISFQELSSSLDEMIVGAGRFTLVNQKTIEDMALTSKFVGTMNELVAMIPQFQSISLGVSDTMKVIDKTTKSSLNLGLVSRNVVKELTANLDKLNQFGFKNGIEGMTKLVQKTQQLKMNMSDVLNIADKVMDPDKALEMSANLQVIGGSIGDFNDPIKMMYMATNDVEGLQEALAKSAQSLVTYNQEQGRFQIFGGDIRRAKAMAEQLGMSYKDLSNIAIQAAQRTQALSDITSQGLNIKEDDRDFLANMAQMKDGRMVIEVPKSLQTQLGGTEVALDTLDQNQAKMILEQKAAFEKMTLDDMAKQQVSLQTNIERNVSEIAALLRTQLARGSKSLLKSQGVDLDGIADDASNIRDKVKGFMETGYDFLDPAKLPNLSKLLTPDKNTPQKGNIQPETKKTNPPVEKEPVKTETTQDKKIVSSVENKTIDVNLKISSSAPLVDSLTAELIKSGYFAKEVEGSFLEAFNPVT
jgi:hypothetical protein